MSSAATRVNPTKHEHYTQLDPAVKPKFNAIIPQKVTAELQAHLGQIVQQMGSIRASQTAGFSNRVSGWQGLDTQAKVELAADLSISEIRTAMILETETATETLVLRVLTEELDKRYHKGETETTEE